MIPKSSLTAVTVTVLLLASACSGPSTQIDASVREFPQKIRLAAADIPEQAIAPLPPTAPPLVSGITPAPIIRVPTPTTFPTTTVPTSSAPTTTTTVPACPTAGPEVTALVASTDTITMPPQPATYEYRSEGQHTATGANAGTTAYPDTSTRTVGEATETTAADGTVTGFTFDVDVVMGDHRTITTYLVHHGSDLSPMEAGLYVTNIQTLDPSGAEESSFTPVPPMLILPFPALEGTTFSVTTSDAASGTVLQYTGEIGDHVRVDACGEVIDTRSVTIDATINLGSCTTPACTGEQPPPAMTFTAEYDIATQYGGLSVRDHVRAQGETVDAPFVDELTNTISRVPDEPPA